MSHGPPKYQKCSKKCHPKEFHNIQMYLKIWPKIANRRYVFVFCLNEYSNTTLMVNFGFSLQTDDPADFFARISSFGFYFLSSANVPKLMTNESLKK